VNTTFLACYLVLTTLTALLAGIVTIKNKANYSPGVVLIAVGYNFGMMISGVVLLVLMATR
jgi:hypothetical protein